VHLTVGMQHHAGMPLAVAALSATVRTAHTKDTPRLHPVRPVVSAVAVWTYRELQALVLLDAHSQLREAGPQAPLVALAQALLLPCAVALGSLCLPSCRRLQSPPSKHGWKGLA
jgi:hypothetical protein